MIRHSPFATRHLRFAIRDLRFAIPHCSLFVFPLLLLWRPLFTGEAFFWGTPLLQFVPWERMAAAMWRTGHLPLWNPLAGCGTPLAANYQAAAFYPLNALHLLLPAEVALSWTTALHLVLAGWGMYGWGRAIRLGRCASFIGALALSGSGFLVARASLFPSIAFTFPWLAVWLWRAEVLAQRRRPQDALWLGLALGLGLLAGHAQVAFYGGLLLVAYLAFRAVQEVRSRDQGRFLAPPVIPSGAGCTHPRNLLGMTFVVALGFRICSLIICSFVIGLCLAAVQLLPTAELALQSQRVGGLDYNLAMTYSMWPWRLITLVAPDFFGNPGRGDYWGYATYWEDAGYVGLLPLLLALYAALSRKRAKKEGRAGLVWFWAACVAVTLVLALGRHTPVFPFLFRHIPGFDLFQAPARWLAVTTIALAALGALGAQWWLADRQREQREALIVVVGTALLVGGLAATRFVPGLRPTFGSATARLGGTLAVVGTLGLLRRDTAWWRVAVGAFVALDLLLFGWPLIPTVDRSLYYGNTETAAVLKGEPGPVRVYWPTDPAHPASEYSAEYRVKFGYLTFSGFGPRDAAHWRGMRETLLPNVGMLDGVAAAGNFDPLLVGRYADLMKAAPSAPGLLRVMGVTHVASDRPWQGGVSVHASNSASLYRLPNALGRAWIVPAARQVAPNEMLAALTDPAFDPAAEVLVANWQIGKSANRQISNPQSLTLQDTPNRTTIRAILGRPGYLVLADTWYPGWRATVDGAPAEILRANYAFRAVWLEAGEHTVEMSYRPPLVLLGGMASLATLALCLVGLCLTRGREVRI